MTTMFPIPFRLTLAAAGFGLVALGLAGTASAHPVVTAGAAIDAGIEVKIRDHRTQVFRRDSRPYGNDPYMRAMRQFDLNRNRLIDVGEKKAFWSYVARTGAYGSLSAAEVERFGQLAYLFDVDRDGRLAGVERRGMDKLIDSLRLFDTLDRNGDRMLTRFEVGFSALTPSFRQIDRNGDRLMSKQELRDDVLRAFRAGEC